MSWKRRAAALALGFVLGTHAGYVALLQDGRPVRIYSVPAACLPLKDQAALSRGIPADTGTALSSLLEDFLS